MDKTHPGSPRSSFLGLNTSFLAPVRARMRFAPPEAQKELRCTSSCRTEHRLRCAEASARSNATLEGENWCENWRARGWRRAGAHAATSQWYFPCISHVLLKRGQYRVACCSQALGQVSDTRSFSLCVFFQSITQAFRGLTSEPPCYEDRVDHIPRSFVPL